MRLSLRLCAAGVIAASVVAIGWGVGSKVEIGGDEHYEVTKGLLWYQGYSRYSEVWNDQPPLHTALLGLSFHCFGATIGVARTLATAFGASLLAACWVLVRQRCGAAAAWLALFFLVVAPRVCELSVSVMLEVPAIGTALWALWPIRRWQRGRCGSWASETTVGMVLASCGEGNETGRGARRMATSAAGWRWLVLSGALFAAALQIKLTAAVVAPALAVEIILGARGSRNRRRGGEPVVESSGALSPRAAAEMARDATIWTASLVGVYASLGALLGAVPLAVLWTSHFSADTVAHAGRSSLFPWWSVLWSDHFEALWAAGAGMVLLAWKGDWRRMAFPSVWFATVAVIHAFHRPWWPYYYLHFSVPLAWLGGYGIVELFKGGWAKAGERSWRGACCAYGGAASASMLLALMVSWGGSRLWSEIDRIRHLPRVEESALVGKMREYAHGTRWVYARATIYPFHAGLVVVPELAVLPQKRFWSKQITEGGIWATVKEYRPEQLLLSAGDVSPAVRGFVEGGYSLVCEGEGFVLYVAKSLTGEGQ